MTDWQTLGEVQYRKWCVFEEMKWNSDGLNIEDFKIFGAPFGGPLALLRDSHIAADGGDVPQSFLKEKIFIFTAAGKRISEIDWENKSKSTGIGWSDQEQLIAVLEDGNVLVYDTFGKLIKSFLILDAMSSTRIVECVFWGDGVVAVGSDFQLRIADGLASQDLAALRKYSMITSLGPERPYTSIELLPPLLSRSGMLEVILATIDGSIIVVDENEAQDQLLQDRIGSAILKMAVAPNGRFLACYRRDGILTVLSSAFTTKVLDFDTKSASRPLQVTWCGEDAVALLWRDTGVLMVGPYGDCSLFPYSEATHIVSEQDCCRVLTSYAHDMIQRVPLCTEAIKKIGSTDPAALLYDAAEAFEEGDPKSDENIRSIATTNKLQSAVEACIMAAAAEFDVSKQQSFLRAASYGKSFCPTVDPSLFVETARKLRVLNNVRHPDIGIPLTIQQFNKLTSEVLISRLTVQNHHLLALRICDLLKLKNERVLLHWACEKVKRLASTPASDEEITLAISRRLSGRGHVSYLEIANSAFLMGRRRLATMILDMEQNARDQIPLLLSMKEDELALQKAINSNDADLIYLTLVHLEKSRDLDSFFRLVHSHTEAVNLLKLYYKSKVLPSDRSLLHSLLMFEKNYMEAGVASWMQAYMLPNLNRRLAMLKESASIFQQSRDLGYYKSVIDEQIDLLETQRALEARAGSESFIGLTVVQTVKKLFRLAVEFTSEAARWDQEAGKVIKKFKISEKIVCHIRVDVLAEMGQWATLARYANDKKPPVGYKPFAIACMKYNQPKIETERYVDRIDSREERFDLYIDLEVWSKAVDMAFKLKDSMRLQEVARLSRDKVLVQQIQDLMDKL